MNYELFKQGAEVYVPLLLLSLVITLAAYGAFPLIFAAARRRVITSKRYRVICFGFNLLVMIAFCIINERFTSWAPYIIWTAAFSSVGVRMLEKRGRLGEAKHCTRTKTPDAIAVNVTGNADEQGTLNVQEESTPDDNSHEQEANCVAKEVAEARPRKRGLTAGLVVVCVLLAVSIAFNAVQYVRSNTAMELSAAQTEEIDELEAKVEAFSNAIDSNRQTMATLREKADLYDFICLELSSGEYGYASSNFRVSESVIVLNRNETGRKFTLTANWPSGGSVRYYSSGLSADISFDSNSWQTSTTMTVIPKREGITKFTFRNTVDSSEFKLMVIVMD